MMLKQKPSLKVNFAGVEFRNPIITSSMTFGWSGKALQTCGQAGAGGVICKSIGSPGTWFEHPRCGRMALYRYNNIPIGMQNNEIFSTIDVKDWLDHELNVARSSDARLIVSIVANPNPSNTADIAKKVAKTGRVDFFEINVSCPMPQGSVGMWIGRDPKLAAEQVKAVKEVCPDIPTMPKMTPNVSDIAEVAKACEKAGADAIAGVNSVQGLIGIDIEKAEPIIHAFGGYSGPAIKPIALRCVAQIAQAVKIPVSGVGGVTSWREAIEMMMVGATTVQVGTAVLWKGPKVLKEITDGISSFLERKGYSSPEDIIGVALKHLTTTEELAKRPPVVAQVDSDKCIKCGVCFKVCGYEAVNLDDDNIASIETENCDGCGLCAKYCPVSAITLEEKGG
jgi:dihydropyrimidine dehydrogenase (NAD+) subunit PreA